MKFSVFLAAYSTTIGNELIYEERLGDLNGKHRLWWRLSEEFY
jgi:hypothetical protein